MKKYLVIWMVVLIFSLLPGGVFAQDNDDDGIPDNEDNCPKTQNGPNGGICISGSHIGQTCRRLFDCSVEEGWQCSNNQEDYDLDSIGDVCDNCPFISNLDQQDFDGDGYGDACDAIVLSRTQWDSFVIPPARQRSTHYGKATVKFSEGDTALIRWDNEYSALLDFRYNEKVSFGNTVFFTMDGFLWENTYTQDGFGWGIAGTNTGITMAIQFPSRYYFIFGLPEK